MIDQPITMPLGMTAAIQPFGTALVSVVMPHTDRDSNRADTYRPRRLKIDPRIAGDFMIERIRLLYRTDAQFLPSPVVARHITDLRWLPRLQSFQNIQFEVRNMTGDLRIFVASVIVEVISKG